MAAARKKTSTPATNDEPAGSKDKLRPEQWGFSKFDKGEQFQASSRTNAAAMQSNAPIKRRKPTERKFNLSEVIKMVYRGRWIILGAFVIAFTYTVYSTYSKPYIYGSSARMFIDRPPEARRLRRSLAVQRRRTTRSLTSCCSLKSHTVTAHVARLLHEYAEGKWQEVDSLFEGAFHSTKYVPPDPRQLTVIRMVDNPKFKSKPGIPDTAILEERASQAVNIVPEATNDYLDVTSEAYSPLDASFLCNLYIACFVVDDRVRVRENSDGLKNYLFSQKERSFDSLRRIENQLRDFLGETNGMSPEDIAKSVTEQYQEMKQKRQMVEIDLSLRKKMDSEYTANLDTVQKNYYNNLTLGPHVEMLQKAVTDLQFDIEGMKMSNNLMDPRTKKYLKDEIQSKEDNLSALQDKLKEETEKYLKSEVVIAGEPQGESNGAGGIEYSTKGTSIGTVTTLRQDILNTKLRIGEDSTLLENYDLKLAELHAESAAMPDKMMQTSSLKRAEGIAEKMYGQLEDRYLEAWMTEESVFGNVRAEDPATLNAAPIRPNRLSSILTGSLFGIGIGLGIVVLLSLMDTRIRTPEEVEAHNVQLLATIPAINPASQPLNIPFVTPKNGDALGATHALKYIPPRASFLDPRSSVAETFRSLRTTILFSGLDKDIQVVALSSSAPQEGKSTTSSNLAIVMAQMGKKTLLVDADLRRPVQHAVYQLTREPGLTNLLFERATFEEAIRPTEVPNLFVLPCGIIPPNPSELLGSQRMIQLIERLRQEFDFVLLDTPPVVAVTDALLLGHVADATIIVARAGVSHIDALLRAMDSVERSGANLLGVVLNDFNPVGSYGPYYKYYQYYQYSSGSPMPGKWWDIRRFFPNHKTEA